MGRGLRTVLAVLLAVLVVGSASWAMAAALSPPPDRTIGDPVVVTPDASPAPTPPTTSTPTPSPTSTSRATPSPAAVDPAPPRDPDDDETDEPDDDDTPEPDDDDTPEPDDDRGGHRGSDDDD